MNKIKNNNQGFTLIELLVVVIIIGILAAIALPQYQRAVDKSRYSTMMAVGKALAEANERYYMLNGVYSTNIKELDIDIPANSISSNHTAKFDWGGCRLYVQKEIICTNNTQLQNQLIFGYNQTNDFIRNKFVCTAKGSDRNSRYAKVCESFGTYWLTSTCEILGTCMVYNLR